jgi:hypothetical protein
MSIDGHGHHGQTGLVRKAVYPGGTDIDEIQFVEMDDLGEKIAEQRKEF